MPHLSTKIIISVLLALAIIGGSVYYKFFKDKLNILTKSPTKDGLVVENTVTGAENFLQSDADNDGLKYWEEALWGTDPNNSDTDGDKTPDGEEVKEGRLPTVAGPNDKMKTPAPPSGVDEKDLTGTSTDKSLTATIARNLYANYAVLGQSGNLTPETQAKIATDLSTSVNKLLEPKIYTEKDIKISEDETPASIKKYGNDVAYAIGTSLNKGDVTEAVSLTNYINKGDPAELKKVSDSANSYKKATEEILKIATPKSAVKNHLALINSTNYFGMAIRGMSMIDDDPLVALISLQNYQSGADKVLLALRGLVSYFGDEKITFTNKDYGYIFSRGI